MTAIPIGAAAIKANPKIRQRCLNLTAAPSLQSEGLIAHREHKTDDFANVGIRILYASFLDFVLTQSKYLKSGQTISLGYVYHRAASLRGADNPVRFTNQTAMTLNAPVYGPLHKVSRNEVVMATTDHDWTKPAAMAIPQEGYFELERGRYGAIYPRTPACYGFSIIAKVKDGREEAVRAYGKQIEDAIAGSPDVLAPLRLHYLRWVLFDVGSGLHFQYQGIFDTDFDKYTEDAVALFSATGITTVFTNLEGFPEDWKENPQAFVQFVRDHHYPSFLEYGEYPFVTADEIKKALRLKASFSTMLDQMQ